MDNQMVMRLLMLGSVARTWQRLHPSQYTLVINNAFCSLKNVSKEKSLKLQQI